MSEFLSIYGEDLTSQVISRKLPIDSLELDNVKTSDGGNIYGLISSVFMSRLSPIFISDDANLLATYISALALLFVDLASEDAGGVKDNSYITENQKLLPGLVETFKGKRFHTFDMALLLRKGLEDNNVFTIALETLSSADVSNRWIIVVDNLSSLYGENQTNQSIVFASQFYFALRNRSIFFIAPMNWLEFANHIETNHIFKSKVLVPICFTPRPKQLPEFQGFGASPESKFKFLNM